MSAVSDALLFARYLEIIAQLDAAVSALEELHRDELRCCPGCSSCCTLSSLLPIEAAYLRQAIDGLDAALRQWPGGEAGRCPLLVDSLCAVYVHRPIICRTHGLPIGYVDHERASIEVSVCPMNFSEEYEFAAEELLFLDHINSELALINSDYCALHTLPAGKRVELTELVARS